MSLSKLGWDLDDCKPIVIPGNSSYVKRAGPLLIGPQLCTSPVKCVTHCLARRDGTDYFFTLKILTLPDPTAELTTDDIQGKILIQTEYSLLKELKGTKGVIQQYGLFQDEADEEVDIGGRGYATGRTQNRLCLALQCYMPNDYSPQFSTMLNLQQFVIKEKRLPEKLALKIFYNVVEVVVRLHKKNIVHRDLKLGNIILDKETKEVTLTNFGLGKLLSSENEQLKDQRGSPAYISPDVISGKPYVGKPSDMWALGVVLYTMLYGQFPFYDASPTELFRKIKLADYQIPTEFLVSQPTIKLIQALLVLDPTKRLTAIDTLARVKDIIHTETSFLVDSDSQVVPDFTQFANKPKVRTLDAESVELELAALDSATTILDDTCTTSIATPPARALAPSPPLPSEPKTTIQTEVKKEVALGQPKQVMPAVVKIPNNKAMANLKPKLTTTRYAPYPKNKQTRGQVGKNGGLPTSPPPQPKPQLRSC